MIDIYLFIILLLLYKCLVTYIKYYEIYGIWLTNCYNIFRLIFGSYDLIPTVTKKKKSKILPFSNGYEQYFHLYIYSFFTHLLHPKYFIFSQIFPNRHTPIFHYKKDDSYIFGFMCNSNFCFYVWSFYWRICSSRIYA